MDMWNEAKAMLGQQVCSACGPWPVDCMRLHEAKDNYERRPAENRELTLNIMRFLFEFDWFLNMDFADDSVISQCQKGRYIWLGEA